MHIYIYVYISPIVHFNLPCDLPFDSPLVVPGLDTAHILKASHPQCERTSHKCLPERDTGKVTGDFAYIATEKMAKTFEDFISASSNAPVISFPKQGIDIGVYLGIR